MAKSFAHAAPIGPIHPVGGGAHRRRGAITLDVNGTRRQTGDLHDMIWDVAHTLAFLSKLCDLMPGDLVFTGTPAGVAAVAPGDRIHAEVEELTPLNLDIVEGR